MTAIGPDQRRKIRVVAIEAGKGVNAFITAAKNGRIWEREPNLRGPE